MNKLTTPGGNRLHNVFGDVEKVFNHFFDQTDESSSIRFQPNWNLVEGVDQFQLSIELPGISREDIHLEVEDCILTFRGELLVIFGGGLSLTLQWISIRSKHYLQMAC